LIEKLPGKQAKKDKAKGDIDRDRRPNMSEFDLRQAQVLDPPIADFAKLE
jgi:hypothetical protein